MLTDTVVHNTDHETQNNRSNTLVKIQTNKLFISRNHSYPLENW